VSEQKNALATTSSTEIIPARFRRKDGADYEWRDNDELLTDYALSKTMGDLVRTSEVAIKARDYALSRMICNAVFEIDIELIQTIVSRIDGTIPSEGNTDKYATAFGDALEDVLEYSNAEQMEVKETDRPIIAMAKAVVYAATNRVGSNLARKKERNLAAKMLLERTGGRKVAPTPLQLETVYVEPKWMGLPKGGEDSEQV